MLSLNYAASRVCWHSIDTLTERLAFNVGSVTVTLVEEQLAPLSMVSVPTPDRETQLSAPDAKETCVRLSEEKSTDIYSLLLPQR